MQELIPFLGFISAYLAAKWSGHNEQALYWATASLMLFTVLQLLWLRYKQQTISKKHWLTAISILALGGITLALHNPVYIKWKPSIVYTIFAAALLISQRMGKANPVEKMLGSVLHMPAVLWQRLNVAWALFFLFMAALNLIIAYHFSDGFWVGFKIWGSAGGSLLFMFGQLLLLRKYLKHDEEKP